MSQMMAAWAGSMPGGFDDNDMDLYKDLIIEHGEREELGCIIAENHNDFTQTIDDLIEQEAQLIHEKRSGLTKSQRNRVMQYVSEHANKLSTKDKISLTSES